MLSKELAPPHYPPALADFVATHDPFASSFKAQDRTNPFFGKHILVLSGADDALVPWTASQEFVAGLNVGPNGTKHVVVEAGAGHKVTDNMIREVSKFLSPLIVRTSSNL